MPRDVGIPRRLERFHIRHRLVSGWDTRGDSSFFPRVAVNHHTAGASRAAGVHPSLGILINGRSDLSGPLCNVSMDYDGLVYVVAAGRANHAGVPDGGSWRGATGNTTAWGLEVEHPGRTPLEPERVVMAARVHAALISGTVGAEKVGQHWEWAPSRKIDLATNMHPGKEPTQDGFRALVARFLANPDEEVDDLPLTNEDLERIATRVWTHAIPPSAAFPAEWNAQQHLRSLGVAVRNIEAAPGADVDEAAIATAVVAALGPELAGAVADELQRRLSA